MNIWQTIDQLPVLVQHTVVSWLPEILKPVVALVLPMSAILGFFASMFALSVLIERKGLGRIQNRPGPNRVGPGGFFQPVADGIKMLTKEDIVPKDADRILHFLAPIALLIPTVLAFAVVPMGRNLVAVRSDSGMLLFFAIGASTELSIFMAGWSSRNKYALLGAMRAIAQMVSYELPLILSAVAVVLITDTLDPSLIVDTQAGGFWHWHACSPWGFVAFFTFLICALAESNRSPFDLPEAESELIAGHLTEYSGFKYAIFFMAEYFGMMAICGMAITLFLGGWNAPLPVLDFLPSWFWFFAKLVFLLCVFIWVRGTLPRLRADQLMGFAWKFLFPMSLVNLIVSALWVRLDHWGRWPVSFIVLLGISHWLINHVHGKRTEARVYRYTD